VRVLLADDHALVRAGIRALLEGLEGVTVVAEAGNGSEVLELARKQRPDVVLLDISMPGARGLEASALLKQELQEVRVVMLSIARQRGIRAAGAARGSFGLHAQGFREPLNWSSPCKRLCKARPISARAYRSRWWKATCSGWGASSPSPTTLRRGSANSCSSSPAVTAPRKSPMPGAFREDVETHRAQLMDRLPDSRSPV